MTRPFISRAVPFAFGALAALAAGGAAAAPARSYNGQWTVQFSSESGGVCGSDSSYTVSIQDGSVSYVRGPGDPAAQVSGQVFQDGTLALNVQRSIATGMAMGRLKGQTGAGQWQVASLGCSGTWRARRRS